MLDVGRFLKPRTRTVVKPTSMSLRLTFSVFLVLASVVAVSLLASRKECQLPHSAAAIGTVRAFAKAERDFHARCGSYASFRDLQSEGYLDLSGWPQVDVESTGGEVLQSSVYRYTLETDRLGHFAIRAQPLFEKTWRHDAADGRFLYLDETFVLHVNENDDGPADADSGMALEAL